MKAIINMTLTDKAAQQAYIALLREQYYAKLENFRVLSTKLDAITKDLKFIKDKLNTPPLITQAQLDEIKGQIDQNTDNLADALKSVPKTD